MATTTPLANVNVTAKLRARLTVTETADTGATGPGVSVLRHIWEIPETIHQPGTGASEQDMVFSESGTVTAGVPVVYSIRASVGTVSALTGDAVRIVEATLIALRNRSAVTGEALTIGGGASDAITAQTEIGPDGKYLWVNPAGLAIGVGVDQITITAAAGTVSYDLLIAGRSI